MQITKICFQFVIQIWDSVNSCQFSPKYANICIALLCIRKNVCPPSQMTSRVKMSLQVFSFISQLSQLSNPEVRSQYNRTLHIGKQRVNLESTIYFLKVCLKENVIPVTFRIPNRLNRIKGHTISQFNALMNTTSREMMKMSLANLSEERESKSLQYPFKKKRNTYTFYPL